MQIHFIRLKLFTFFVTLFFSHLCLAQDWSKQFEIENDVPGQYSYDSISKKNYSGITIKIITKKGRNLGGAVEKHARQFEKLTGAKCKIEFVPFPDLYSKDLWGLKQGTCDIIFGGRKWLADFAPYLEPLPGKLLASSEYSDITFPFNKLGMWENQHLMVVIDGDRHFLQYRLDLVKSPPETWKDFTRIAEKFNKTTVDNGKIIYGASEITSKNNLVYAQFFKRAAAYAKHPDVKGGFYFELSTMKPLINTPGFVEALRDFVEIQAFYPPGGKTFTLTTAADSFANGETVLSDMWGDAFYKAVGKQSPIRNRVGAGISPGAKKVWNRRTGQWDMFPNVHHVHFIPSSWSAGVSKNCRHKEAAFDFLGFFANRANHISDLQDGTLGINSFRASEQNKAFWVKHFQLDEKVASSYVETLKRISQDADYVYDLNIPQARRYMRILSNGITRALTGRSSPQEALDNVAQQWEELNQIIGIDKQRAAYSNMVQLEDRK